jgi:glycosyltransferase involved in cell wall biosynthesis
MENPAMAVVHPRIAEGGGSEASALWMLEALQDEGRLTLITMGRPDFGALNRAYGTGVDGRKVACRPLPVPAGMGRRFDALRGWRLARYCRRYASEFDVMISAYNVMDFGRPGIQRIGDFSFDDRLRRMLYPSRGVEGRLIYHRSPWRSAYLAFGRVLSGTRASGWKRNLTIANSRWTRDLLRRRFGLDSVVVYPPALSVPPRIPWEERENGFVVMGRVVPEKGIDAVIGVLDEVRRHNDVHLHIIGKAGDQAYARRIAALAGARREWVFLEGGVYGPAKDALLGSHKYGLSGCRHEAFGIAVAEMVKAGCLVWVPEGGGQVEIVDHPDLVFADRAGAVSSIVDVLDDPEKQAALRRHLAGRAEAFSAAGFGREIRRLVRGFLDGAGGRRA